MLAIEIKAPGGPEALVAVDRPIPSIGPGEVLVKVAAAGVNRPDLLQRQGRYPPPPGVTDIPGLEVAGTIERVDPAVTAWRVGDPVCALVSGGGYAEFCAVPAPQCLPIPRGCDVTHAAAIPETTFTVWTNVFERGRLAAGESILIHGGSSGIGTTAIQLARARGARVFATAGSAEKCAACEALGAEQCVNYRDDRFRHGDQGGNAWARCRRRARHGGRRLRAAQYRRAGDGRPARDDRTAGRREVGNRHHADSTQTPDAHRFDAAHAIRRRKRRAGHSGPSSTCGRCSSPAPSG